MRLQTILNRVQKCKSCVYEKEALEESADDSGAVIRVRIRPRENSRAVCSRCSRPVPVYDRTTEREFEFIPLWGLPVFFVYHMRRVNCPTCRVRVEKVPWCDGKNRLTHAYRRFPAGAKVLSSGQNGGSAQSVNVHRPRAVSRSDGL